MVLFYVTIRRYTVFLFGVSFRRHVHIFSSKISSVLFFTPLRVFDTKFSCFPLKFEWLQVFSSLQDSPEYSGWS